MPNEDGSPTPEEVAAEFQALKLRIIGGDYDGFLVDIAAACGTRVQVSDISNKWKCDLGDLHVTEDDLTFDEVHRWSKLADRSWIELRPLDQDIDLCWSLLVVLHGTRLGLEGDAVQERMKTYTFTQVLEAFSNYEVAAPPLDQGDSD